MDCNIALSAEKSGNEQDWNTDNLACVSWQRGSVLMLHDLIYEMVLQEDVSEEEAKKKNICPQDDSHKPDENVNRFFAKWSQYEEKADTRKEKIWRVEEFLGYQEGKTKVIEFSPDKDLKNAEIVILDDSNLGFRDQGKAEFWKISSSEKKEIVSGKDVKFWTKSLATENEPWVIVKMCNPVADGNLWKYLHEYHAEKMIVVLTIDDLRLTKVQISRELSWELTAQDLVRELIYNPTVNALAGCAFVVVLFGTDGAVLLSRPNLEKKDSAHFVMPQCDLFFDPAVIEGMWRQKHAGGMIGYKTCMTASIALALQKYIQNSRKENKKENEKKESLLKQPLEKAVSTGLLAIRKLHLEGYGTKNSNILETNLTFPNKTIAAFLREKLSAETSPFVSCPIKHPVSDLSVKEKAQDFWTILSDRYKEGLGSVAIRIVKEGIEKVLNNVPLGKFGKLTTVDRREIEGFRSIRSLVNEYVHAGTDKPISIAVFGAPGSGKSFGIAQMAESLLPGKIKKLTFNLSQFSSPNDIWDALHQVRDESLTEKIPLVFWDEFDTTFEGNKLGWLRYFLAPMQDGEFQQGQITHPIGQAIFVFAGGTAETMKGFDESEQDEAERKKIKLPDFISRLKGFVNILGPNPTRPIDVQKDRKDNYYIIRRAILLRSILERNTPQFFNKETKKLQIDDGVLRALLEVPRYKHGVRSMESVIAMSLTKDKMSFERSSLPSEAQLALHVDADDFMSLVIEVDFSGDTLDTLARKVHAGYEEIFEFKRLYDSLSEYEKDSNKGFAQDIINKLRECKCLVVAERGIHQKFDFTDDEIEKLAKMEHHRWLKEKIKNGFRYASVEEVDKAKQENLNVKINALMFYWDQSDVKEFEELLAGEKGIVGTGKLSDDTKKNNIEMIKKIPEILAVVGYTIVRKQEKS